MDTRNTTSRSTSGNSSVVLSKNLPMKTIIEAINEYLKSRTENSSSLIKKFLQAYSVTIDVSIFDPDREYVAQFYVSLYELLSKLESHSQMIWDCVDVLSNASRSCAAREALINTYQFGPLLARFLGDELTSTKRKTLLKLMQELTCGIKLTWQIPNLSYLITTLTKWIEDKEQDEEIVCLSLGVLVNLCYKNLPAVYTFSRCVDSKKFLRFCLPLRGPLVEVHVCKLMIIIDSSQNEIQKKTLLKLIEPTFISIEEALNKNDPVMLRLVIDFFIDVIGNDNAVIFKEYKHYVHKIDHFLKMIIDKTSSSDVTPPIEHDPACIMHILKLIFTIITNDITNLSSVYKTTVELALKWINPQETSFQALTLITTIAQKIANSDETANHKILKLLSVKLPQFLMMLESESHPSSIDSCKRLGILLQLMRVLLKSPITSDETLAALEDDVLRKVVNPIMSNEFELNGLPKLRIDDNSTTSTEIVDTYVYAVCLVNEVSQKNSACFDFLNVLVSNKTLQCILAQALCGGPTEVKKLVLELAKYHWFPANEVASAMHSYQNMFYGHTPCNNSTPISTPHGGMGDINYPGMSVMQMETLDDLLKKFKKHVERLETLTPPPSAEGDLCSMVGVPTRQLMDLYEYKAASLAQAERAALSAAEAAHERAAHMQHRLAQLASQADQSMRLLHKAQTALDANRADMARAVTESERRQNRIETLDKNLKETEKELQTALEKMSQMKETLEGENAKKDQIIQKLEEHCNKMEKQLSKREEQIKNANKNIENMNKQIQDLQKMVAQKDAKLTEMTKQYLATKEIINTITKVAASQMP
nr:unnamed protein product [Callosobruchus chinensis]